MKTRQQATVSYARCGVNPDYQVHMLEMGFDLEGGGAHQGLGGICFDEDTAPKVSAEVCALFGVKTLEETVGRNCFVLRCWPTWGESIEGIEVDGKRWTLSDVRRRFYPEKFKDRLTERTAEIQNAIDRHGRDVQREVERLRTVRDGYVDWSSSQMPSHTEEPDGR